MFRAAASLKRSGEEQHKKAVCLQLKQIILLSAEKGRYTLLYTDSLYTPIVSLNSLEQIKIPLPEGTVESMEVEALRK